MVSLRSFRYPLIYIDFYLASSIKTFLLDGVWGHIFPLVGVITLGLGQADIWCFVNLIILIFLYIYLVLQTVGDRKGKGELGVSWDWGEFKVV